MDPKVKESKQISKWVFIGRIFYGNKLHKTSEVFLALKSHNDGFIRSHSTSVKSKSHLKEKEYLLDFST